ncbi:MAG: transposase [Gammaproteobacteria bacterium]|nr:transposase [Gammaproteobacteria bacterium]
MNTKLLNESVGKNQSFVVDIVRIEEVELDEMWSFVKKKSNQRWLWHAIDHNTHKVLAYHFGKRKDCVFRAFQKKLSCFDIDFYFTDDWGAYERHLPEQKHLIGKRYTQAIE